MIELPYIWVPPRRLILPPRELELPHVAAPALVQQASGPVTAVGGNFEIYLGAPPTPGDLLIGVVTKQGGGFGSFPVMSAGSGRTFTAVGSAQAHTFGGFGYLQYRVAQSGDSSTISVPILGGNQSHGCAEFSGVGGTLIGSAVTAGANQVGPAMGLGVTPGASKFTVAAFATWLVTGGTFTANGSSSAIGTGVLTNASGADFVCWCWGIGNITIGGTQGGSSNSGSWTWGGIAQSFDLGAVAHTRGRSMMVG